jgi:carboxypeptidase Q
MRKSWTLGLSIEQKLAMIVDSDFSFPPTTGKDRSMMFDTHHLTRLAVVCTAAASFALCAPMSTATHTTPDADRSDLAERFNLPADEFETVMRIIDEGQNRNQIMKHLTYLCEEIGSRLTGSSRLERANFWAAEQFESFGLQNIQQHEWGTIPVRFDRGPSTGRMLEPVERDFEFTTRAWTAGTDGPAKGRVFREPSSEEEFDAIAEYLEGAWILRPAVGGFRRGVVPGGDEQRRFLPQLREAGIAGLITTSRDDLVRTGRDRQWRELDYNDLPTDVTVMVRRSDYDAINSRLHDDEEVIVEFHLDHTFVEGPIPCYNTIAEIPGTVWPEQVVIISGHLDSWDGPGSQGTVDNGTGSSVTIEAARILMAAGAKPKRTIRFILWTGEEQGLLGSRVYVEQLSEQERANITGVFVDDSGTNHQASITCTPAMVDMLEWVIDPMNYAFPEKPIRLNVVDRMPLRGASDHAPFNRVGIPGFFWGKAGRANYRYAWHTQHDRLDQAIEEYLIHNSTVSAIAAYMLANADELLSRHVEEEEEETEESSATE